MFTAAYVSEFRRLPKHRQAVSYGSRSVLRDVVTAEECARRCLLSTDRPCHGFNYKPAAQYRPCTLLHAVRGAGLPAVYADDTDFYQRHPGCVFVIHTTHHNTGDVKSSRNFWPRPRPRSFGLGLKHLVSAWPRSRCLIM